MKKKILFVNDEMTMGGVARILNTFLRQIDRDKYDIDVLILHKRGELLDEIPDGINVIGGTPFFNTIDIPLSSCNITNIFSKIILLLYMKTGLIKNKIKKERKKILNKQYDVEFSAKEGFCTIFTAYGDSKKKYHWLHTDYSMYDCTANYKKLFIDVFSKFNNIIAISKSVSKKFTEKYEFKNMKVIYNLINTEKIIEKSKEFEIKNDSKKINFISVGRFHNMKGYDRLIDAFAKLKSDIGLDNVTLRLIGNGPDFDLVE